MDVVFRWFRKAWRLIRRKQFGEDLAEEIAFHREQVELEFQAEGMSSGSAHDSAAQQFGNETLFRERSREVVEFQFETAWQDLRYAFRQLRKNPGFAAAAILTLSLGIGASTAIFSAVNPILFEPLPYPHAGGIMMIWEMRRSGSPLAVTFGTFHGMSERSRSFETMAVIKPWQPIMVGTASQNVLSANA